MTASSPGSIGVSSARKPSLCSGTRCSSSPSTQKKAERICTFLYGTQTSQLIDPPSVPSNGTRSSVPAGSRLLPAESTIKRPAAPACGRFLFTRRQSARSWAYFLKASSTISAMIARAEIAKAHGRHLIPSLIQPCQPPACRRAGASAGKSSLRLYHRNA